MFKLRVELLFSRYWPLQWVGQGAKGKFETIVLFNCDKFAFLMLFSLNTMAGNKVAKFNMKMQKLSIRPDCFSWLFVPFNRTHCIHFTIQFFHGRQVSLKKCLSLFYSPLSKGDGSVTVRTTNNAKPGKRQNTELHQHGFHLSTFPLCKCVSIDIFRLHGMSLSQMVHHGAPWP